MVKVRRVYVVTSNPERVPEFQRLLQLYGIEVCHASPFGYRTKRDGPQALLPLAEKLLEQNNEKFWTKSVMYELVLLLCRGTEQHADAPGRELVDGEAVTVSASLTCWSSQKGEQEKAGQVEVFVYRHEMDAKIDLSKRREDRSGVFNWDDVVVDLYSGLSYHEKKLQGFKVSPRDMMLSQYLQDHVYYRRRRLCRHNHLEVSRAVDFGDGSPALNFFRRNPYLFPETETSTCSSSFFRRAFVSVLNQGLVLRAAMTRREFIYWLPGLNAGIPLVPKDDAVHEATFQAHDLAHFLLPDLLFTGEDSPLHRRLYIIYRMLSEAITLVFADMLFVEHLRRSGVEYDWSKRKIWPLFRHCGLDPFAEGSTGSTEHFLSVFRALLEANVSYCLLGDDSRYRELLKDELEPECLKDFKEKYMPFFVEDFRWTSQNYRSMAARGAELRRWWSLAEPIRELLQQGPQGGAMAEELLTVEEFATRLGCHGPETTETSSGAALVWSAFRDVFARRIAPIFQQQQERSCAETLFRAFGRYMMGQCILLARFNFLPESTSCHEEILGVLQEARDAGGQLTEAQMLKARGCFENYVDLLLERQLITLDDAATFKEVCPLFEPCFAAYDEPLEHYQQLKRVSQEILGELPSVGSEIPSAAPKAGGAKKSSKKGVRLRWVPKQH